MSLILKTWKVCISTIVAMAEYNCVPCHLNVILLPVKIIICVISILYLAPPLSVENVATILEQFSLNEVCEMLYIPNAKLDAIKSEFSTDNKRLRALIQYWLLKDIRASWRRLIIQLDNMSLTKTAAAAAADSIRNYAEMLTGQ